MARVPSIAMLNAQSRGLFITAHGGLGADWPRRPGKDRLASIASLFGYRHRLPGASHDIVRSALGAELMLALRRKPARTSVRMPAFDDGLERAPGERE